MNGQVTFKAIIVGFIVDVIATSILAGIFIGIGSATFFASTMRAPGGVAAMNAMASNAATMTAQMAALMNSPLVIVGTIVSGALGSLIGGYVSGVLAPGAEVKNAAAMGALGLAFALLMLLIGGAGAMTAGTGTPLWATGVSALLTIPAAICGGALRAMKTTPTYEANSDSFDQK